MYSQTQFTRLIEAINMFQSDYCEIADATDVWFSLSQNANLYSHKESVLKLIKIALTPYYFLAYILHFKYTPE